MTLHGDTRIDNYYWLRDERTRLGCWTISIRKMTTVKGDGSQSSLQSKAEGNHRSHSAAGGLPPVCPAKNDNLALLLAKMSVPRGKSATDNQTELLGREQEGKIAM